jgi:FkbM family methyltransferase
MVLVDRLDAFCSREAIGRVDFVKIDVEGAELQVLQGGREVIEAHRPPTALARAPGTTCSAPAA